MTEAFITPALIAWARERSHETVESAARKVKTEPDKLAAWESGRERPSLRQAQDLARKLRIPFGYLYLSHPPEEKLPLPDLRTVAGAPPLKPSPDFLDVLYDVLRKQQWYREYLEGENTPPVPFIGKFKLGDDPKTIAADVRETLGINDDLRQKSQIWGLSLMEFVRKAECARVLVLRSSIVGNNTKRHLDVEEFRGFAISDALAPLVFINSSDAKAAQIFTLAHELAHLWIGQSGISNPDYAQRSSQQQNTIDRQCDSIAAEILVPEDDFALRWNDFNTLADNLGTLAAHYRVSAFVVLRRAYELGKVQTDEYRDQYKELLRKHRREGDAGGGGGNFYLTLLSRNSNTFTTVLMTAAAEGRVPPREAANLLNVRIATLRGIENYFLGH